MGETPKRRQMALAARKQKLIEAVKSGASIQDALLELGVNRTTYERWRAKDADFAAQVNEVRTGLREGRRPVPDFETFCRDWLDQPLYWHQLQWVDVLEGRRPRRMHPAQIYQPGDPQYILVNTPPEHAKTTTLSINYVTWRIVKDPNIKIMLVSKTADMAKEFVFAVKTRLSHPRYQRMQMAFGPPGGWKEDAAIWAADQIYLGSERDSGEKDPTLQAVGIGGHIYGSRSDLIIVDDGVVLGNAHQFELQIRWLQQEVITRLGDGGSLLVVGTRVDSIDLYRELMNPDRYPTGESPWTYFASPAVLTYAEDPKDWETLWPRAEKPWPGGKDRKGSDGLYPRWDGLKLARRRALLNPRTWTMAYQQANVDEEAVFPAAKVRACVNGMRLPGRLNGAAPGHRARGMDGLYVIGSMDPAMVGDTGVIVYGVDRHERKRYVLDARLRTAATPAWIRDVIKELTDVYGIHEWRIEKNAFQQFLTQDPELNEWLGSRGIRLSEHHTGKNKWDASFGVASMAALFEFQLIELPSTAKHEPVRQIVEQLITWSPETKGKTDMVMALWFAEIRAREVCQASSVSPDGPATHMPSRFMSRRRRSQQTVINLNDLAIAKQHGNSSLLPVGNGW